MSCDAVLELDSYAKRPLSTPIADIWRIDMPP